MQAARGSWQRGIASAMLSSDGCSNPVSALRGRAKNWSGRYDHSFHTLLTRMRAAGYTVRIVYGPKGGLWSARFYATEGVTA